MTAPVEDSSREGPDRRQTWVRRLVWVVLLVGIVAFLVRGANNPPDPFLVPEGSATEAAAGPPADGAEEPTASSTTASTAPGSAAEGSTTANNPPPAPPSTPTPPTAPPRGPTSTAPVAGPTPSPLPSTTPPTAPSRRPLSGFDEVAFRISGSSGGTDGVALLADDGPSRSQGLMNQTDLRGYDAMVFRFPSPSEGGFFMRNTLIPLSIAFFDVSGRFVSSADMEPCPDEVDDCPTFQAERPYVHAIEVAQGDLPRLGIGPGSVLSFPVRS